MKRTIIAACCLAAGAAGVLFYYTARREREFVRLIDAGQAALKQDQTFVAIEAFSGAIALKSDSMLPYLKRGETYRRRGDLTSAARDLRTAAHLDPTATQPLDQLGDLNLARQMPDRAAEAYAAYLKLDDRSSRVFYKLALARRAQGNLDAAMQALRDAIGLNDRFADAHYLLALCLRERQQPAEAVASLRTAVRLAPALIPAREELADLYDSADRHREAIDQFEALRSLEPARAERHVALGLAYARAGRTDLAIGALGAAVDQFPEQPQVYAALGRVWLQTAELRGDTAALRKALEAFDMAANHPDADSTCLAMLGRALLLANRLADSEQALLRATNGAPIEPAAYTTLAIVAQRLGHFDIARQALLAHASLTGDPGGSTVATRVADLSMQLDEPAVAALWYARATKSTALPDATLLAHLAEAQFHAGDRDAARSTLKRALALEPGNAAALELTRQIR